MFIYLFTFGERIDLVTTPKMRRISTGLQPHISRDLSQRFFAACLKFPLCEI
jgi:hypothetical protein